MSFIKLGPPGGYKCPSTLCTKYQENNTGGLMAKKELATVGSMSFEKLKRINEHSMEYWSASDILITLPTPAK